MSLQPAELVFRTPSARSQRWRPYLVNWERYFFPVATGAMIFIPVDLGTSIFLLPGMLAIIWSLVILLSSFLRLLAGIKPRFLQDISLPVLTLLLWWVGMWAQRHSYAEAKAFALSAARTVQDRCDAEKRCPARIETWVEKPRSGRNLTKAGWSTSYWLDYKVSDDRQSFAIRVRRNIDFADMIHAGVGREPGWIAQE